MEDKLFKNLNKLINLRTVWNNILNNYNNLATGFWNLAETVDPAKDEIAKRLIAKLDAVLKEAEQEAINIKHQIENETETK